MIGFLLPCKCFIVRQILLCRTDPPGRFQATSLTWVAPPIYPPAANLPIYWQYFWKRSSFVLELKAQENKGKVLVIKAFQYLITEGSLCLILGAHIVLMMNNSNQDDKILSVTSGSSNSSRPPVILFKMVDEQKSQFISCKQPMSQFVEQQQIRMLFLYPTSWNVSICSFKGLWGFMLVTSGKLSLRTRGNTHKRSHTRLSHVPASFRNQFSLNYLAPIPDKSGLVALNVCLISCC